MSVTGSTGLAEIEAIATLRATLEAEIESGRMSFPVMPEVATKVREIAMRPTAGTRAIAEVVEADPALVARVLKMANSAMYSGLAEIRDLTHAVGRLGASMISAVAIGAAGKEAFRSKDPQYNAMLRRSWRASLFAAAGGRAIAPSDRISPDEVFLGGLLFNSGFAVLVQSAESWLSANDCERPSADRLRAAIEGLAPLAGSRLLGKWGLPDLIVEGVLHQNDPAAAPDSCRPGAVMIGLAARIGLGAERGEGADLIAADLAASPLAAELALDQSVWLQKVESALAQGAQIATAF